MANFAPGSPIAPSTTTIAKGQPTSTSTKTLLVAATEYSFLIPAGTKRVEWRARSHTKLHWALTVTDSGNANVFQTLKAGNAAIWELQTNSAFTVYVQAPNKSGEIVEILFWS